MDKKTARIRRATKTRARIRRLRADRLCIHRTPRHTYAQIISADGGRVVAAASTLEKALRGELEGRTANIEAARVVGRTVAERAREKGIDTVAFDRSGFKYHGRVRALAEAAREAGLNF